MTQALYAHMNNKTIKKEKKVILKYKLQSQQVERISKGIEYVFGKKVKGRKSAFQ
jgi:F0F1-type ATP synthase delta subunit